MTGLISLRDLPVVMQRLLVALLCAWPGGVLADLEGPLIITEFASRYQVPYEMEQLTVKLVSANGKEELRRMRRYSRKFDHGQYRHLLVVDAPASIAGTALLAWQEPGKPNRYWSHLPAEGETRERATRRGGGQQYFMGTDLTYEDIAAEAQLNYAYSRQPDQKIHGIPVFVVRAEPASFKLAKESGYKYRELFLRRDNYALLRIDYYNKRGKFIKRLDAREPPQEIPGDTWRVDHFVMENKKENHRTELIVVKRELEEIAVPAALFEVENLGRHSALVKLRR